MAQSRPADSFPRRQALTRRFTLGEPRDVRVSGDGARVTFLRSSGPVDPVNALWVLDVAAATERLAADPRRLDPSGAGGDGTVPGGPVPAAERARRERARETASGIVTYDADDQLTTAVFALGGRLWRAGLDDGPARGEAISSHCATSSYEGATIDAGSDRWSPDPPTTSPPSALVSSSPSPVLPESSSLSSSPSEWSAAPLEPLQAAPGAFDPRLSPDGSRVAYVAGSALRVTGDGADRVVAHEPGETVAWGSAEFVAAEEMGRSRGHWWSPDGRRLLAARVDTASVPRWWISDPASPEAAPAAIRYPAAGAPNASVTLAVFDVCGAGSRRVDIAWNDGGGWEYLAAVCWSPEGLLLTVQSRDQRTLGVLLADPDSGSCRLLRTLIDEAWVELVPGSPRLAAGRLVTVEDRGPARRLCADGEALTGDKVQVRAVHHADEDGVLITASVDPADVHVARVGWDGGLQWLTEGPGVNCVAAGGDTTVIIQRSLAHPGRRCTVRSPTSPGRAPESSEAAEPSPVRLSSNAEEPGLELNVEFARLGSRRLSSAMVMPAGSGPAGTDGDPLPVLLDPYGGPHAQRVQHAESLFHTSQWFADQGFAVLVIDGRGTPGRGPAFERAVRGDLAGPALQDQIDGLQAAAALWPRLDLSRVAIRGWSFGGYLAALAVLRRPDVFAAAVAGAPVTDWRLYDTHYTERYLGHPAAEAANYERTDLCALAPALARPLLLIHGLADDNVVAAHTLRLSRALLEAGRPHTVLPLSGVTHMTPQEEVAENLLLIQLRFLQQALATPTPDQGPQRV